MTASATIVSNDAPAMMLRMTNQLVLLVQHPPPIVRAEAWVHRSCCVGQFVRAAGGDVDIEFWRRIYNPADAYGGEVITGWAARFYPNLAAMVRSPPGRTRCWSCRSTNRGTCPAAPWGTRDPASAAPRYRPRCPRSSSTSTTRPRRDNRVVALHAGLVGVAQDPDGALRPVAGWHLTAAQVEVDDVIDLIEADHQVNRAARASVQRQLRPDGALPPYGSATLFDGRWRLLPVADHRHVYRGHGGLPLITIIDLADSRSIAAAIDDVAQTIHSVVCRIEQVEPAGTLRSSVPA